jgi:hypothetical protein
MVACGYTRFIIVRQRRVIVAAAFRKEDASEGPHNSAPFICAAGSVQPTKLYNIDKSRRVNQFRGSPFCAYQKRAAALNRLISMYSCALTFPRSRKTV